jgi:hypothetical protein
MITLDTPKHKPIREDSELSESLFTWTLVPKLLDWVQEFLVEDGNVLHTTVATAFAATELIHVPIKSRARTLLAEIACERANVEETDEGEELANAIL